jgi:hypothetical protein
MKHLSSGLLLAILCVSCAEKPTDSEGSADIDVVARDYLFLELSMGLHDAAHVDAYFGPEDIKSLADTEQLTLADIEQRGSSMRDELRAQFVAGAEPGNEARIRGMVARLEALLTRIALNNGETLLFDEEAKRLFGTSAPNYDASHFDAVLQKIDALLPGEGSTSDRVNAFRQQFVVSPERLPDVFSAAIEECRRRTLAHIKLPENESFRIEYVNDKPWSGYNWYEGNAHSLIQVNTDLPIFIDRAIDLGCHEGYPGHHTFNALLEENLVRKNGWLEFTIYPLFSPESLIAEGSGNYGIQLAFPGNERIDFERNVLFPMAGLDDSQAETYYQLLDLLGQLSYSGNEAARDYLNGEIDRDQAIDWLVQYSLNSKERAEQRTKFFDTYRSYVINYNFGKDMVREYIERGTDDIDEHWRRFEHMLSSPMLPADLL